MVKIRYADSTNEAYEIFKQLHEKVSYSDIPGSSRRIRTPFIKSYEEYCQEVESESIIFIVEEWKEKVIGYALVKGFPNNLCKISEMYIDSDFQRVGNGRSAVNQIAELAKEEGFTRIQVFSATMATDNFWFRCRFWPINNSDLYERRL